MRVVVALGGNALLRRGEPMTVERQRANVAVAAAHLAPVAQAHSLVVTHGNGPQIGLLALEAAADPTLPPYPLDVLGAETQGMIGVLVAEELRHHLPDGPPVVAVLTTVEVDPADPAFATPTKPIGPRYRDDEAARLRSERGWAFAPDGDRLRRVVPSPAPHRIVERDQIATLLDAGVVVIAAGGGGVPVVVAGDGTRQGAEAVVDKDLASALLATALGADVLVLATDADAAYIGYGGDAPRAIRHAHPDALLPALAHEFATGSMLPKVTAAASFARDTGRRAAIGHLHAIDALVRGDAGTQVSASFGGIRLD